jgi:hypothetical protein
MVDNNVEQEVIQFARKNNIEAILKYGDFLKGYHSAQYELIYAGDEVPQERRMPLFWEIHALGKRLFPAMIHGLTDAPILREKIDKFIEHLIIAKSPYDRILIYRK